MENSENTNSVLSDDLSDVSLQLENESNTIEDSILTSEDDTYNMRDKKTYENEVGKRKHLILDSTNELDDSSVLHASKNNSEIIDNSYSSDQEEGAVQKSPKRSSIRNRRNISVGNQNEHDSNSECEESFIKPRVKKNRIISSDSSDTDLVTPQPNRSNPRKSSNQSSDSSDDDKTVDLEFGKPSNGSAVMNKYSKRHNSIKSTNEDSSYRRRSRTSTSSNSDASNISRNKDESEAVSLDKIQNISDSDKTVDLGIAIPALNKYVPQDTNFEQCNSKLKSPDKSSDFRQKHPISHLSSDGVNIYNHTKTGYRSSIDKTNIDEEVANISLELSKSKISERQFDSINIGESDLSETEQPLKVGTPALRLTEEFHFGKNRKFMHSTIIEPQDTPVNKNTGKRLLNKSIDTPRSIKQIKESDTPRNVPQIFLSSSSSDEETRESDDDIIDVSSDEEVLPKTLVRSKLKQTKLDDLILKDKTPMTVKSEKEDTLSVIEVTPAEYNQQNQKVKEIETDLLKSKNLMRVVKLEHLPDKGKSILLRHESLETQLLEAVKKLSMMKVTKENPSISNFANTNPQSKVKVLSWEEIENKAGIVQPKTFGKQAMSTYNAQKAVTMDRLHQLHGSLKTCPTEDDLTEDPKGLKVDLMPHQKRALTWLMWREMQKPSGGILADDMGLGKTLTMISLMLKTNEIEKDTEESSDEENSPRKEPKYNGGTLVVCPATLINQWSGELERRTKRGLTSCEMYHGPKRETKPKKLAKHDMVITTYAIVNNECDKNGAIFRVKWRRIVIDEAHQIRNHKSQTSEAVCRLSAKSRWALTGTPVHNKELDMYALLKFIRCTPFDDLAVWKRWVGDKSTGGTERLHTVISSLMLRRTKIELIEKGFLNAMPERKWELVPVELNKMERDVYSKILIFSRTLFAQFLHQRAEKNQDAFLAQYDNFNQQPNGQNKEYVKMREKLLKLNKLKDIKQHEILVLLLRLRQICCHASLITSMLNEDMDILGEDDGGDKGEALDLLEQLNKLTIDGDEYHPNSMAEGIGEEALGLKEAARGVLNPSDPVFSETSMSSKIRELIKVLRKNVLVKNDKAIIVSQWSSFLRLISYHLKAEKITFDQLDGNVPVPKRMTMVDRFNNPKDEMKVLLLSLTAGGVGLNLIGANHLFLLDLHWNPQLENQAQDRIYRMGQKKDVFVYKFMATDTIEKRILDLQEKKLEIAQSMLTGTKQAITSKLSLQDLKMLFEM
ncbi:transcription termination factor lodestar [Leptinotarsa decemlineata]|uniref:transcription termination factor lodestar n=1 Tax=Leptinotarsa decemlineata TaxID=7539 RepID=UPI003D30B5E5